MSNRSKEGAFPATTNHGSQWGMTLREYMATQAMAGYCGNTEFADCDHDLIATYAAKQADALLAELERTKGRD